MTTHLCTTYIAVLGSLAREPYLGLPGFPHSWGRPQVVLFLSTHGASRRGLGAVCRHAMLLSRVFRAGLARTLLASLAAAHQTGLRDYA